MFQKKSPSFCNNIISEYLRQFISYDFYGENALKLVEQFALKYKLPKEYKEYYIKVIETNEIIKQKIMI